MPRPWPRSARHNLPDSDAGHPRSRRHRRQYLKIGGELLAFNVDKNFSDVLDGLVDLRKTDAARLETYMGKEGVARFMEHHREMTATV